jgi:hypothetical protein
MLQFSNIIFLSGSQLSLVKGTILVNEKLHFASNENAENVDLENYVLLAGFVNMAMENVKNFSNLEQNGCILNVEADSLTGIKKRQFYYEFNNEKISFNGNSRFYGSGNALFNSANVWSFIAAKLAAVTDE